MYLSNFIMQRKEKKPKFKLDLVRPSVKRNLFIKSDTTTYSDQLYTNTNIIDDTIPTYHTKNLPERYNNALFKKQH